MSLFSGDQDLWYDGMLSVSERYISDLNVDAQPKLFGQDWMMKPGPSARHDADVLPATVERNLMAHGVSAQSEAGRNGQSRRRRPPCGIADEDLNMVFEFFSSPHRPQSFCVEDEMPSRFQRQGQGLNAHL